MFKNKNILITGASSGIGLNLAKFFYKKNSRLILISKNKKNLSLVKTEVAENIKPIFFDLTNFDSYEILFEKILKSYGKIDYVIHAAGSHSINSIKAFSIKDISESIDLNLKTAICLSKFLSNNKYLHRPASIIFVSSVMAVIGEPGQAVYSASKSGIVGLTRSLASELSRYKIRLNSISPGSIKSPMLDRYISKISQEKKNEVLKKHLLRTGEFKDINNLCEFLLSNKSSWITGQNIIIDGGYSL